jgi:hypothetical protein
MSATRYRYRAHGLNFHSDIDLPELDPFDGHPDVVIQYGQVPERLNGAVTRGRDYEAALGRYLLDVPGIARYFVTDGRDVRIAPAPGADDEEIRPFILSSVMGALAHQKGLLALHASAVEVDGRSVLFAGASGAGKSTLAAAFHDRGYPLITDDIAMVSFNQDGHPLVHAGNRRLKLSAACLEHVGASLGARRQLRAARQKYSVVVPCSASAALLPIARVFLLAGRNAPAIALHPLSGQSKVSALVRGTYRRRMLTALGQSTAHFAQCTAVGRRVEVVSVDRPVHLEELPRLVDRLEAEFRSEGRARA